MHKIKPIKEKLSSQGAAFYVATIHSNNHKYHCKNATFSVSCKCFSIKYLQVKNIFTNFANGK